MALLQGTDYIVIHDDGRYEIYNSAEERDMAKNAPSRQEITDKYRELLNKKREWFFQNLRKDSSYTTDNPVVLDYDHYFFHMENLSDKEADEAYRMAHKISEKKAIEERRLYREMKRYMDTVDDDSISYEDFKKQRFPFMIKYFPDIYYSKIKPRLTGQIDILKGCSQEEAYERIKSLGLLGHTEDI